MSRSDAVFFRMTTGVVGLMFLTYGWIHGYNWALVYGIVAMFGLYFLPDAVTVAKDAFAPMSQSEVKQLREDLSNLKDQVNILKLQVAMRRPVVPQQDGRAQGA